MPDQTTELKRSATLDFEGGMLTINLSGFGDKNGSGCFVFDEEDVQWHPHDEKSGCYLAVDIPRSEMVELRDWLTKQLEGVSGA